MLSHPSDDSLLLIRCPTCGQRFKVGEDLRERTVECGGCESRFRINDEVIVRGRKFYPGERKDPGFNRFQRVPLAMAPTGLGPQAVNYGAAPNPSMLEPVSPLRILAGAIGVGGMVIMGLLLMFGASRGGMLDGMVFENRMVMAGFASFMGISLLVFANPRARLKALGIGLLFGIGLLAIPFKFTVGSKLPDPKPDFESVVIEKPDPVKSKESERITALRNQIGIDPLVKEINRLAKEGSSKQAVGLWLRGLSEMNRILIRDYIFRTTGADASSANYYPRGGGDFLMVITGARQSLRELVDVVAKLGEVVNVHEDLSVIEVRVNNENFTEGPIEKLSKKEDPAFYDLNKRELESIDLERVKHAVQRLGDAEPKVYRADITRKLIALLGDDAIDFKGSVCSALSVWSEQPGPAGEAALKALKILMEKELAVVPEEIVALIVKEKNLSVIPYLDALWLKNPSTWEALYESLGAPIEATLIGHLPKVEGPVRYSAVRMLGGVGGAASLPALAATAGSANPEMRVLLESAQKSIHERLAR